MGADLHTVIAWTISGALTMLLALKSWRHRQQLGREKLRRSFYQSQVAVLQEHTRLLGRIATRQQGEAPPTVAADAPPRYDREVLP